MQDPVGWRHASAGGEVAGAGKGATCGLPTVHYWLAARDGSHRFMAIVKGASPRELWAAINAACASNSAARARYSASEECRRPAPWPDKKASYCGRGGGEGDKAGVGHRPTPGSLCSAAAEGVSGA